MPDGTETVYQAADAAAVVACDVVFVDARVEEIDDLIAAAQPGTRIFALDPNLDGLDQIAN